MKEKLKIAISSDHAGFIYKKILIEFLEGKGYFVKDFGCFSEDSVDYPDFAHIVAKEVEKKNFEKGIILCGSGNGVAMAANKHKNIRAAICWTKVITRLSRTHNNANICCIPARFISVEETKDFVEIFLKTEFEKGRHERRVKKIEIN